MSIDFHKAPLHSPSLDLVPPRDLSIAPSGVDANTWKAFLAAQKLLQEKGCVYIPIDKKTGGFDHSKVPYWANKGAKGGAMLARTSKHSSSKKPRKGSRHLPKSNGSVLAVINENQLIQTFGFSAMGLASVGVAFGGILNVAKQAHQKADSLQDEMTALTGEAPRNALLDGVKNVGRWFVRNMWKGTSEVNAGEFPALMKASTNSAKSGQIGAKFSKPTGVEVAQDSRVVEQPKVLKSINGIKVVSENADGSITIETRQGKLAQIGFILKYIREACGKGATQKLYGKKGATEKVVKANGGIDPTKIGSGQKLKIPKDCFGDIPDSLREPAGNRGDAKDQPAVQGDKSNPKGEANVVTDKPEAEESVDVVSTDFRLETILARLEDACGHKFSQEDRTELQHWLAEHSNFDLVKFEEGIVKAFRGSSHYKRLGELALEAENATPQELTRINVKIAMGIYVKMANQAIGILRLGDKEENLKSAFDSLIRKLLEGLRGEAMQDAKEKRNTEAETVRKLFFAKEAAERDCLTHGDVGEFKTKKDAAAKALEDKRLALEAEAANKAAFQKWWNAILDGCNKILSEIVGGVDKGSAQQEMSDEKILADSEAEVEGLMRAKLKADRIVAKKKDSWWQWGLEKAKEAARSAKKALDDKQGELEQKVSDKQKLKDWWDALLVELIGGRSLKERVSQDDLKVAEEETRPIPKEYNQPNQVEVVSKVKTIGYEQLKDLAYEWAGKHYILDNDEVKGLIRSFKNKLPDNRDFFTEEEVRNILNSDKFSGGIKKLIPELTRMVIAAMDLVKFSSQVGMMSYSDSDGNYFGPTVEFTRFFGKHEQSVGGEVHVLGDTDDVANWLKDNVAGASLQYTGLVKSEWLDKYLAYKFGVGYERKSKEVEETTATFEKVWGAMEVSYLIDPQTGKSIEVGVGISKGISEAVKVSQGPNYIIYEVPMDWILDFMASYSFKAGSINAGGSWGKGERFDQEAEYKAFRIGLTAYLYEKFPDKPDWIPDVVDACVENYKNQSPYEGNRSGFSVSFSLKWAIDWFGGGRLPRRTASNGDLQPKLADKISAVKWFMQFSQRILKKPGVPTFKVKKEIGPTDNIAPAVENTEPGLNNLKGNDGAVQTLEFLVQEAGDTLDIDVTAMELVDMTTGIIGGGVIVLVSKVKEDEDTWRIKVSVHTIGIPGFPPQDVALRSKVADAIKDGAGNDIGANITLATGRTTP